MFWHRRDPDVLGVGVAFTRRPLDLSDRQEPAARRRAFGLLAGALGVAGVAVASQVHSDGVLEVDVTGEADDPGLLDRTDVPADALVTTRRGVALAVRVADCVPVLFADADSCVVAAAHAGRAGLLAGVLDRTVDAVRRHTTAPLRAWIGPHVCARCYEVPDALAADVARALGTSVPVTRWGTAGIDLGGAARRQLQARGVRVEAVTACTLTTPDLWSHRRDGAPGRQAGVVWLA